MVKSKRPKDYLLSIETSCDDTSFAILEIKNEKIILKKHISQGSHSKYGGVVPEIASREHTILLQKLFNEIVEEFDLSQIKAVAVTKGPGLIGSLLNGMCFAKGIAISLNIPLIGVNHLQGHLMSAKVKYKLKYPLIFLLVSGGHSQIVISKSFDEYELIGETLDDSTGEVFDKMAKFLDLGYPGGPIVEKKAEKFEEKFLYKLSALEDYLEKTRSREKGNDLKDLYSKIFIKNKNCFFEPPMKNDKSLNFSFSGLKTQIKNFIQDKKDKNTLNEDLLEEICYEGQKAIIKTLANKLFIAIKNFKEDTKDIKIRKQLAVCGGVSANKKLNNLLFEVASVNKMDLIYPPLEYATDNAVMIGLMAIEKYKRGIFEDLSLDVKARMDIGEI